MRSDRVVVLAPLLDDDLCFLEAVEDFAVEQLIAEFSVEGFAVAVLPGTAWFDVEGFGSNPGQPVTHNLRSHLSTIVRADMLARHA